MQLGNFVNVSGAGGSVRAGLTGVVAVVETDTERLARLGDGRAERGVGDRAAGVGRRAPLVERVQLARAARPR